MRAGAHDASQLEVRRRLELCAGEDPQSVTGGRLAAGGHGREREQQFVEDAVARTAAPREVGPPSHRTVWTEKRSRTTAEGAGEVDAVDAGSRT